MRPSKFFLSALIALTMVALSPPALATDGYIPIIQSQKATTGYGQDVKPKQLTGDVTITTLGVATVSGATGAFSAGGDITFVKGLSGGADISVATQSSNTAGDTLDLVAGAGGPAATDSDGKAGGNLTLTAGAGSAKNGAGSNDGNGGVLS